MTQTIALRAPTVDAPALPAAWPKRTARLVGLAAPAIKGAMPAGASVARTDQERRLVDLIGRIARHRERDAFVALFDHFAPRIKAYLVRLGSDDANAEELTQEVMLAVWRRAASFNPSLAAVSTWVFTIARNKRIDRLRRERRPEIEPDDPALVPEPETPADVALEAAQTGGRLRAAIADLPGEQQQLLLMAFFEDKSHSAIAAETRLPLGTVKSRIRLALIRLRGTLEST